MGHYPYQQILRATPDGAIVKFDARAMQAMVRESRLEAENTSNDIRAAKTLMGAGREAFANGYVDAASSLYREACERLAAYAGRTYSHAGRDLHYRCAAALDRIYRSVSGREPKVPELTRARGFYMSLPLDYEFAVLHVENSERFRKVEEYCRRHGIE